MKSFLIAFIIFLIWAFFGLWLYSWLQTDKESTAVLTENTSINKDTLTPSAIDSINKMESNLPNIDSIPIESNTPMVVKNDQDDILFLFEEGIISHKNSTEIIVPESTIDFKYKINTYLIEHPNKEVQITSIYSPDENTETPNIGVQRGNKVKQILITTGIASKKIVVKPVIKDINFDENEEFSDGFSFSFKPWDKDRVEDIEINIPESVTVYPKFSETGIIVNNNLRNLFEEVKTALTNNPEMTIAVIGHTDNVGNANDNYSMGLQYARQVRWYLISKGGFEKSLIKAISKGETEPIDTNNSKRGRNANRRIEIVYNYNG
ncbi:OmpA family protein [Marixanthomonas ophiurae]|uniref:OmpA family protein n=1 Tax=Marixanthomonas ophiurae TaxID=387659 RepID=A0A3E1Q842_9FLAO|nr:OmpA family protein [Marixanthomonas ophiurae]RFN58288.1 OmpA family protein [Marixanthomonas ophiurae]